MKHISISEQEDEEDMTMYVPHILDLGPLDLIYIKRIFYMRRLEPRHDHNYHNDCNDVNQLVYQLILKKYRSRTSVQSNETS
jgi:hypothetical protein